MVDISSESISHFGSKVLWLKVHITIRKSEMKSTVGHTIPFKGVCKKRIICNELFMYPLLLRFLKLKALTNLLIYLSA